MQAVDIGDLLAHQSGVVSRRQVVALGLCDDDIARMVRRRVWTRLFQGVYVDHTGPPSWLQRAWGATLLHAPAALSGWSALRAAGVELRPPTSDISLVVAAHRRVNDPPGVRTRRSRAWDSITQLHLSPPRVRLETAALYAASDARTDDDAVALLGDLVQSRRTTPARLRSAWDERTRLPRRRLLGEVLTDVGSGAVSALERRYLREVERAHGLPAAARQRPVRSDGPLAIRDVDYPAYALAVELDGRLGHELWRDRWDDLDRDLHGLAGGTVTIRAGWGQVLQPCRLARVLDGILRARGWHRRASPCGPTCALP